MNNLQGSTSNKLLWLITAVALGSSTVACWNSYFPPSHQVDSNLHVAKEVVAKEVVTKEAEPQKNDTPLSSPTLKLDSAKALSMEATVRFPTAQVATDKNKLEEEAFSVANGLVAKRPQDPKAIHVAAVCNSQLSKTAEAQRLWLQCVELNPNFETYYLNLAANALFRGDTEFALSILEKAEAKGLNSGDISHHKGLALARLGEDERAVAVLKKAIEDKSSSPAHLMLLGQSQLKLGEYEDAKSNLLLAVDGGVRNRALYLALMNASLRLKQPEDAAKYREIVDSMGDDSTDDGQQRFNQISEREARRVLISVLAEASSVYEDAKMFEDAEACALRLLAMDPGNYGMCKFLAELYKGAQKVPEEIAARERIVELAPNDLMNYLQLSRTYSDSGQPNKTIATLKLAISVAPSQAVGYAAMAEFLIASRNPTQAKWYAERALEREASPAGYKLLASILRSNGDEVGAQKVEQAAAKPK